MQATHLAALLLLCVATLMVECSVLGRDQDVPMNMIKRGLSDPNDPRNLYRAMYSSYKPYKRGYEAMGSRSDDDLVELYNYLLQNAVEKRGLRDPNDPRNLFRSVYGYRK